jgi:hypothetical protein
MYSKAETDDYLGRFREIVSDPLNLLITRDSVAGMVEDEFVYLHNGNKVPISGIFSYYDEFSKILVINRGVHEPLEEYVFQELLKILPQDPTMLELGAYWGHYSMWLKKNHPKATVYLVEPDETNIQAGKYNFQQNKFEGKFIKAFVGKSQFEVDTFMKTEPVVHLDVLHADIQGYEVEMLEGCSNAIQEKIIDYIFVSTHSQEIHHNVIDKLSLFGYRIEVSADVDYETTSFDGFVFASNPFKQPLFQKFTFLGREEIIESETVEIVSSLERILHARKSVWFSKIKRFANRYLKSQRN